MTRDTRLGCGLTIAFLLIALAFVIALYPEAQ